MSSQSAEESVATINQQICDCTLCPRLVSWRKEAAENPPARFKEEEYWGRPLPGFGDKEARMLVVGLAPAAHGGNRTGRIFTGDRSGDWLFRALHKAEFANQPTSIRLDDGLRLKDCYISAVVRCAPPGNKPLPEERDRCLPYLVRELRTLSRVKVVVALGGFAWAGVLRAFGMAGWDVPVPMPRFGHLAECPVGPFVLLGSFHPSQQNTFTGKLTEKDFDRVFARARAVLDQQESANSVHQRNQSD
ncbi:MAG TPA: uracil-DNA glycosylase [Actinomycetota bacterium]|nr:uracil-DNA glycosylase [Actinomycetota bacterium]